MNRSSRRASWWRVLALLTAFAIVAAACGDDDDSADTDDTSDTAAMEDTADTSAMEDTADTSAMAETSDGEMSGPDLAAQRVADFTEAATALPYDEPLGEAPPEDVTVFYVQCGVAVCGEILTGIEAATAALGWNLETSVHEDTPDTVAAAFDAAIAAEPDVVLTSGNPREWFADQLATLESNDVPVVAWSLPEEYEPGDGIAANLLTADDYYFYGVLMADYLAVESGGSGDMLFVGLPTFPVLSITQEGFMDEIAVACPDCNVDLLEVDVTALGGDLPGQIVSEMQANPDLAYVAYAFGGMLFGVDEALEGAGLLDQAIAVSQAGGALNFGLIAGERHQAAEVAIASGLLGWRAIDVAARTLAGEDIGTADPPESAVIEGHPDILAAGLPLQILQKDDMGFLDSTELWPGVEGFEDKFIILWGG